MSHSAPIFFLASESPRRKKILQESGFQFTVLPIKVSERIRKNLNSDEQIKAIAWEKMEAALLDPILLNLKDYLILTADTMVVLDEQALGKPADVTDAEQTLLRLSGRGHLVKTAVCLYDHLLRRTFCQIESTEVIFRPISRQEILDYVATGEPMDKAGSYAIQGGARNFVQEFRGDFNNVVGLSPKAVETLFIEAGRQTLLREWNVNIANH